MHLINPQKKTVNFFTVRLAGMKRPVRLPMPFSPCSIPVRELGRRARSVAGYMREPRNGSPIRAPKHSGYLVPTPIPRNTWLKEVVAGAEAEAGAQDRSRAESKWNIHCDLGTNNRENDSAKEEVHTIWAADGAIRGLPLPETQ